MTLKFKALLLGSLSIALILFTELNHTLINVVNWLQIFSKEEHPPSDISSYINNLHNSITSNQFTDTSTTSVNERYLTSAPVSSVSYNETIQNAIANKNIKFEAYQQATTQNQKKVIIESSREDFITAMTSIMPYWYGTPWDFNGTSSSPQQGKIACGYFVTTILQHAGLNIERNKLAQQASENIIKTLTHEKHIKRYSNTSLAEFNQSINEWGQGLYIVGLDFHVGFIWHDGSNIDFIHSTFISPGGVLSEPAENSKILENSRYRVLGKISDDDEIIINWLNSNKIYTKT